MKPGKSNQNHSVPQGKRIYMRIVNDERPCAHPRLCFTSGLVSVIVSP